MSEEQRDYYFRAYGIRYIMSYSDDKYEYGYYAALSSDTKTVINYKFRLSEFQ